MALTNHERVGKAMDLPRQGLGDPVVQLQTNFGGGKTYSMLALYHLFGGSARRASWPAWMPRWPPAV
jgi:predicted AAA+ superfamily ATPase